MSRLNADTPLKGQNLKFVKDSLSESIKLADKALYEIHEKIEVKKGERYDALQDTSFWEVYDKTFAEDAAKLPQKFEEYENAKKVIYDAIIKKDQIPEKIQDKNKWIITENDQPIITKRITEFSSIFRQIINETAEIVEDLIEGDYFATKNSDKDAALKELRTSRSDANRIASKINYAAFSEQLQSDKPETEEEKAAREKKEKEEKQVPDEDAEKAKLEEKKKKEEEEAKKKSTLNSSRLRLNEQAALILNADKIISYAATREKMIPELPRKNKIYKNFATYRNGSAGAGGHIDMTKHFFKDNYTKYLLKDIPPHVVSTLLPSIKIYKIFFPEQEKATPNAQGVPWRIPFDELSTEFKGKTSQFQQGSLEELLMGSGRLHGVGIKSFRYKYVGTNPAEVNTNIEASLELYFQDVRDLVKEIKLDRTDKNFLPLLKKSQKIPEGGFTFSYADLIADVGRKGLDNKYNEHYYRIKIIAGYELPSDNFLKNLIGDNAEEVKKIKSAINSSVVILYLNPYKHELSFEENGSISLKIDYTAAMTSVMNSLNIFETNSKYSELAKKEAEYQDILKSQRKQLKKINQNCDKLSSDALKVQEEKKKEELKKQIDIINNDIDNSKNEIYSDLFSKLLGIVSSETEGKIYSVSFKKEALGVNDSGEVIDKAPNSENNLAKNLSNATSIKNYKVASWIDVSNVASSITDEVEIKPAEKNADGTSTSTSETETAANAMANRVIDSQNSRSVATPGEDAGYFSVNFVYLGDILDTLGQIINVITDPTERVRIILTDFTLQIPILEADGKTLGYKTEVFNIADLPISVEMLKQFYLERVIKPRRSFYPLSSLITNLMTDIVAPAVSPSYFGKKALLNRSVRLSSLSLSIPFEGKNDIITGKDIKEPFNGSLSRDTFKNKNISESTKQIYRYGNIGNYYVMYCSNQLATCIKENNGDTLKDEEDGIYHFYIGSDKGFIKKLKFSRVDAPFAKEAKNVNNMGNKSLGRLRELYDVTVDMFGNNIYRPGEYIYIEPLFFSGDVAVEIQDKLGLGGYYHIIDVETNINQNMYDTTLRCVLYGHIENNKVKSESVDEEC